MSYSLQRRSAEQAYSQRRSPVDARTRRQAFEIIEAVQAGGDRAVSSYAQRFGDCQAGEPLVLEREQLLRSLEELPRAQRAVLERTFERVRDFALAQRECIQDLELPIPGGRAGHRWMPFESAGCYAPGGRFPLPSSVIMTVATAKAAGVQRVVVASPRPNAVTRAAAALAGADALVTVGGAQAIAALAYGTESISAVDFICGPGNRWVTAAKQLVYGDVGIDMLAGPSELTIIAESGANPDWIAADLLAQAEHDPDALPILISTSANLLEEVNNCLEQRVADGDLGSEALCIALSNGFAVVVDNLEQASQLSDQVAPEHLSLFVDDPGLLAKQLRNYGALFLGPQSPEASGDYGAGPNHVLPTGGSARFRGGLSVFDFTSARTWLKLEQNSAAQSLLEDAASLADLEGLQAHRLSALART